MTPTARTPQLDDADRDAILAAEAELLAGILAKDRARSEAALSPDFVAIGHAGNVVDRERFLGIHFSPERDFVEYRTAEQDVALLAPGVARVVGWTVANTRTGPPVPPKRYLATVVHRPDGRWLIATWQETPITDERF